MGKCCQDRLAVGLGKPVWANHLTICDVDEPNMLGDDAIGCLKNAGRAIS